VFGKGGGGGWVGRENILRDSRGKLGGVGHLRSAFDVRAGIKPQPHQRTPSAGSHHGRFFGGGNQILVPSNRWLRWHHKGVDQGLDK
jgi:hypothetical protein